MNMCWLMGHSENIKKMSFFQTPTTIMMGKIGIRSISFPHCNMCLNYICTVQLRFHPWIYLHVIDQAQRGQQPQTLALLLMNLKLRSRHCPTHHDRRTLVNLALPLQEKKKKDFIELEREKPTALVVKMLIRPSISLATALIPNSPILFPSFPERRQKLRAARRNWDIIATPDSTFLRLRPALANYFPFLQSTAILVERAGDRRIVRLQTKVICAKKGFMLTSPAFPVRLWRLECDRLIRFVSLYVIIVFIRLFNCVDLIMQPKIEMVFCSCLFVCSHS